LVGRTTKPYSRGWFIALACIGAGGVFDWMCDASPDLHAVTSFYGVLLGGCRGGGRVPRRRGRLSPDPPIGITS